MSHHNDDFREATPRDPSIPEPEPVASLTPDPLTLQTPEPLIAAEPPPIAPVVPVAPDAQPEPVHLEPSWRTIVGGPRAEHPWGSSAPSGLGERVPQLAEPGEQVSSPADAPDYLMAAEATDLDAHGSETAGTVPAAAVPLVPVEAAAAPVHREVQPSVTLARIGEELFAWLKTLASAAVYATLIVTFGFQVARVEGQSMAPTLENQDRLIVNKLAYRIGQPQVGDIVMLYYPLNPDKSFVKRVIAEEGDQIRIVDGRVYRNDVPLNDDYVPPEYRSHDDYGPEVVPQGYYFVMGDHRNNSSDSRHWKFVPKKYIIGKVQLRWWPLPQARIF
jgi:signal peptidase I